MFSYEELRKQWIELRKDKKNLNEIQIIQMKLFGLIIDKILKQAKSDQSVDYDAYVLKAIKSELKQAQDANSQGVQNLDTIEILKQLLPKELSDEELSGTIIAILAKYETPNIGLVMKDLKKLDGVNMQKASSMVKELI